MLLKGRVTQTDFFKLILWQIPCYYLLNMLNSHILRKCLLLAMRHVKPHQVGSLLQATTLTLNKGNLLFIKILTCNLLLPGVQILCPCDAPMLLVTLTAPNNKIETRSVFLIWHWWLFVSARSNIHYIWFSVQYLRTTRTDHHHLLI